MMLKRVTGRQLATNNTSNLHNFQSIISAPNPDGVVHDRDNAGVMPQL
jgi:hypothetical protein